MDAEQIRSRNRLPARRSEKPTIAVLPFRPLAHDHEHHWFADGLTDDIATALTRSRQLTVVSRPVRAIETAAPPPATEVAEALGVQYVVDGSVRLAGSTCAFPLGLSMRNRPPYYGPIVSTGI
ncbi:hypothetical protein [Ensifer sp. CCNWLW204]|uniref:hypothetical protein n=1 Tax=Ensifer sp. CCNWLW204 TaxID=3125799 RepID=UPI003014217C